MCVWWWQSLVEILFKSKSVLYDLAPRNTAFVRVIYRGHLNVTPKYSQCSISYLSIHLILKPDSLSQSIQQ